MRHRIGSTRSGRVALAFAAVVAVIAVGVAYAAAGANQAEMFVADFDLTATKAPVVKECQGPDARYRQTRASFSGPITATVEIMRGTMRVKLDSLVNLSNGLGSATGTWTIVDQSGKQNAKGTLEGLFPAGNEVHAFVLGGARDTRMVLGELNAFTDLQTDFVGRIGHLTPSNRAVLLPVVSCR